MVKSGRILLSSFALRRVPKRESPAPDSASPPHASSEPACSSACASCGQESRKSAEADDSATCLAQEAQYACVECSRPAVNVRDGTALCGQCLDKAEAEVAAKGDSSPAPPAPADTGLGTAPRQECAGDKGARVGTSSDADSMRTSSGAAPSTLATCAHATLTVLHIVMLMFYCLFMVVHSVTCDMHRMLSSDETCTRPGPSPDWTGEGWPDPPHECRHERCDRRVNGDALCGECAWASDTRSGRPYCTKCSNAHEEPAEN